MPHKDLTFTEMREQLTERAEYYRDEFIPSKALRMNPENGNIIHAKEEAGETVTSEFELMPWGLSTLGIKLGIPGKYAQKCPPELRAENFNYWLEQNQGREFFMRFDGAPDGSAEKIRAVLSKQYADFPNTQLAKLLEDHVDDDYDFIVSYEDDGCKLIGDIVSQSDQYSNDDHAAGIHMANSEVGQRTLVFETLVYSKALKSGIIVKEWGGFAEKHIGDKTILADKFRAAMDSIMKNYGKAIQVLEDLKTIDIEDAEDMLTVICNTSKLKIGQQLAVKQACAAENPKSLYDIVSVFTRASTTPDLSPEDRESLQRVGGTIMVNSRRYKRWEIKPEAQLMERSVV